MRYMRKFATVITGLLAVLAVVTAQTQEAELPGTERTILNRADLEGAQNMEVISSLLVVQPGAAIPAHFHNGIESGRVLEGGLIQMPGKEPQRLETGSPISICAELCMAAGRRSPTNRFCSIPCIS